MTQVEFEGLLATAAAGQPFRMWRPLRIGSWLEDVIEDVLTSYEFDLDVGEIKAAITSFYDSTIRPFDIPYVPGNGTSGSVLDIEKHLDDAILKGVLIAAEIIVERVKS